MNEEIVKKLYNASKNLIIHGDMATGKTKIGIKLAKEIINENESMLVIDAKEEYLKQYQKLLKEKNYNIIIINLRNLKKSEGWNILDYPYQLYQESLEKAVDFLDKISKQIFKEENTTSDPFWLDGAANLFTASALALFEDAKKEEINISSINNLLSMTKETIGIKKDYLTEYFKTKENDSMYASAYPILFAPKDTRECVITVAKQKLRLLDSSDLLRTFLSKTTFDFNTIATKPTAIFLITPDEDTHFSNLTPILIEEIYSILLDKKNKQPFHFLLDNFDTIYPIHDFLAKLGGKNARNINFLIITRSKKRLEKQYGKYINTLTDEIKVEENTITITQNSQKKQYKNTIKEDILKKEKSIYPTLKEYPVPCFDPKKYVLTYWQKSNPAQKEIIEKGIQFINVLEKEKNPFNKEKESLINELIEKIENLF